MYKKLMNDRKPTGYYREECNKLAPYYDALVKFLAFFIGGENKFRNKIAEIANISRGEFVLDVACGTGTLTTIISERVGDNGCVIGVDLSPKMIAIAARKVKKQQLSFQQANAEELPYPDNSFDKVTITYALHEMPHEARLNVLSEIFRVLKTGGTLVVVDIYKPRNWFKYTAFRILMLLESDTAWDLLRHGLVNEIERSGFSKVHQIFIVKDFIPVTLAVKTQ
jgi:ubiquinone/menaquinone biosynthesis methyltransferase